MKRPSRVQTILSRFMSEYGMLLVLLVLCGYYSWATWEEQHPSGAAAAKQISGEIADRVGEKGHVLIVGGTSKEDTEFTGLLRKRLNESGFVVAGVANNLIDARQSLKDIDGARERLDVIACTYDVSLSTLFEDIGSEFPSLAETQIVAPHSYKWPVFLKGENLINIAEQIAVIAVIAIGMTMVIITAGIDLSVGSLIALSAVVATVLIRDFADARETKAAAVVLCCLAGIATCAAVGLFTGCMVTFFRIPPFIVTLSMMLVARGLGYILAEGQAIPEVPGSITWLGRGTTLGFPNAVILMLALYLVAHVLMTYTIVGRYTYAVGGNMEAARLSGVPIRVILLLAYTVCGALAGLGGVITASQLSSGSPTYGWMYELYVIAAVVVGGTSLAGGEGKVLGTLIGAFIIAVIRNGMNLTGVESYTQDVVLGLVILGAVLLDMLKKRGWSVFQSRKT